MPKINVHGLNMYYEFAGEGDPLVLVSGLGGDHLGWTETQVPAFVAAGYRCLTFDNRDAGQTDESSIPSYTIRQFADDTAALLEQLAMEPAHLLGVSMGGMILQEYAIYYPKRVRSLTLVCTTPQTDPFARRLFTSWQAVRRRCTREEFYQMLSLWIFTHRFYGHTEAVELFMQKSLSNPFPQSVDGFLRQCEAILTHDALDRLGGIKAPTHVIVGDEDILTAPRYSHVLAERILGAGLTAILESGHAVFWERPSEFNQAVIDFLKEH